MSKPFIASKAIAAGALTRGRLRSQYFALHRDIYVPKGSELSLRTRTVAAWLRTGGSGVIAGRAAAALHGSRWCSDDDPIEVIAGHLRPQPGIVWRQERLRDDEVTEIAGMPVTTPARTLLDLGRHLPRDLAVMRMDALAAATGVNQADSLEIAKRYPGARGIRRAHVPLALMDAGAQSPRESWLRLVLFDGGLPRPRTQIEVSDGTLTAFLDLGWDEPMIGMDYEGMHHAERPQLVYDIGRYAMIDGQGWLDIRVVKEHSKLFILHRVREAFAQRNYSPSFTPWF